MNWEWLLNQIQQLLKNHEQSVVQLYQQALIEIQNTLNKYYLRYSQNGKLTLQEMRTQNRLNAMLKEFVAIIDVLSQKNEQALIRTLESVYEESYYMTSFLVQKQVNDLLINFRMVDPKLIKEVILMPIDKLRLPQRLRKHRTQVLAKLRKEIGVGLLKGESYSLIANRLKSTLDGDAKKAIRTARTESARCQNRAAEASYQQAVEDGVQLELMWLGTLDTRTRLSHQKLDGQRVKYGEEFNVSGHKAKGPHDPRLPASEVVNCRCTTVAIVAGIMPSKRRARGEDGRNQVIAYQSYTEWKESLAQA